jgi:hypothetical protein
MFKSVEEVTSLALCLFLCSSARACMDCWGIGHMKMDSSELQAEKHLSNHRIGVTRNCKMVEVERFPTFVVDLSF